MSNAIFNNHMPQEKKGGRDKSTEDLEAMLSQVINKMDLDGMVELGLNPQQQSELAPFDLWLLRDRISNHEDAEDEKFLINFPSPPGGCFASMATESRVTLAVNSISRTLAGYSIEIPNINKEIDLDHLKFAKFVIRRHMIDHNDSKLGWYVRGDAEGWTNRKKELQSQFDTVVEKINKIKQNTK